MDDSYHHQKHRNPNLDDTSNKDNHHNSEHDDFMIVSLPPTAQHQHPIVIPIRLPSTTTTHLSNGTSANSDDCNDDDTNVQSQHQQQTEEWAMIEINGELYIQSSQQEPDEGQGEDTDNDTSSSSFVFDRKKRVELGSLSFIPSKTSSSTMVPVLIIGTHQLQGTIVPLQQPFVVLHKQLPLKHASTSAAAAGAGGGDTTSTNHHYEYEIQGIIKHKLLFNQYPKTILR